MKKIVIPVVACIVVAAVGSIVLAVSMKKKMDALEIKE